MRNSLLILFLLIVSFSFSQDNNQIVNKIKDLKELLDMDVISQKEYDSLTKILVNNLVNQKSTSTIVNQNESFKVNQPEELTENIPLESNEDNLVFEFDQVYKNQFMDQGRTIKEVGFGGILVSTSLRSVYRDDGKYYIFDVSVGNNSGEPVDFYTSNIRAQIFHSSGKSIIKNALTSKQYQRIKNNRQNLRSALLGISAGLNAASAGYSSSSTYSSGNAYISGNTNSNTYIYGSYSNYLGSLDTSTRFSGNVYGSSSSYTTNYDGAAAYAASQNEQAKLDAFINASNEAKRRWNDQYLKNDTVFPLETTSGLINVPYFKAVRVDLIIPINGYDYVFEWLPGESEN